MTITANDLRRGRSSADKSASQRACGPRAAEADRSGVGKRHIAALDGMRGIAVLLVLFFHFKLGPFHGGFVGVTVFFTLSGFLICSRTLSEIGLRGRFAVLDFFERRVRRLAPAAILCILGVVIATNIVGTHEQHGSVPGDALAALANVANWRFLIHGTSYTDLFAAPSPLNHFWSLAIEEQFYLVFPAVVWLVLKLPRRYRVFAIAVLVSGALEWSAHAASTADSYNRFYYGTDARASELLVGVILALSIAYWRLKVQRPAGVQRFAVTLLAGAGLVTIFVTGIVFRNGGLGYEHGGAFLVAVATAALIVGGLEGANGVARICSVRPLVWVGKVSYGAYLYHWPIFALSGKHWGPLHGAALGLTQLAVSLALAGLSFRFLEAPIQRRRFAPTRRIMLGGWSKALAGAALVTVALALFNPPHGSAAFANAGTGLQAPPKVAAKPGTVIARTNAVDRPLRVIVAGDSTGGVIANALVTYQNAHPKQLQVLDLSRPGCPITQTDFIRNYVGESGQNVEGCDVWPRMIPPLVRNFQPDVTLVFASVMEQTDQRSANSGWDNLLDPSYRQYQEGEYDKLIDALGSTGAPIMWADVPYFKFQVDLPWVSDSQQRTDQLNAMFRELPKRHPNVHLLNYAAQLNRPDHSVDTSIRPDGIHMNPQAASKVTIDWLLPQLQRYKTTTRSTAGGPH